MENDANIGRGLGRDGRIAGECVAGALTSVGWSGENYSPLRISRDYCKGITEGRWSTDNTMDYLLKK